MLGRFRSAVTTALDGIATFTGQQPDGVNGNHPPSPDLSLKPKFTYGRPHFLKLSPDEVQASSDHSLRPILIPRNATRIAWNAGYAEVVNAGKSKHNEDQAACHAFDIYVDVPSSNGDVDRRRPTNTTPSSADDEHASSPTNHSNSSSALHPLNGVLHSHPSASDAANGAVTDFISLESTSTTTTTTSTNPFASLNGDGSRKSHRGNSPSTSSPKANPSNGGGGTVLSFTYFAMFDGHAGTGCALWAANTLHYHIKEKLSEVAHLIAQLEDSADGILTNGPTFPAFGGGKKKKVRFESMNHVTADTLIKGALEKAFVLMDQQIGMERHMWRITGGCTVVVALFFKTRLFIANAGDSRGIVIHGNQVTLSSKDFTPESERQRIQHLATLQPHLLGAEFTALQFPSRIAQKDIGKPILYRDYTMKGWAFKTAAEEDLKYPVVLGEGKRARVLATIGVTRGFGDYDLCAFDTNIHVKPFLTPAPDVFVYDLAASANGPIDDDDVVVLATDGLWDVLSSQRVAQIIANSFVQSLGSPRQKYTMAAQEVVMQARGMQVVPASQAQQQYPNVRMNVTPRGWRMAGGQPASGDDISCFIIPLRPAAAGSRAVSTPPASAVADRDIPPLSPLSNPSSLLFSHSTATASTSGLSAPNARVQTVSSLCDAGEGGSSTRASPELEQLLETIRKSSLPMVKGQLVESSGGGGGGLEIGEKSENSNLKDSSPIDHGAPSGDASDGLLPLSKLAVTKAEADLSAALQIESSESDAIDGKEEETDVEMSDVSASAATPGDSVPSASSALSEVASTIFAQSADHLKDVTDKLQIPSQSDENISTSHSKVREPVDLDEASDILAMGSVLSEKPASSQERDDAPKASSSLDKESPREKTGQVLDISSDVGNSLTVESF